MEIILPGVRWSIFKVCKVFMIGVSFSFKRQIVVSIWTVIEVLETIDKPVVDVDNIERNHKQLFLLRNMDPLVIDCNVICFVSKYDKWIECNRAYRNDPGQHLWDSAILNYVAVFERV